MTRKSGEIARDRVKQTKAELLPTNVRVNPALQIWGIIRKVDATLQAS